MSYSYFILQSTSVFSFMGLQIEKGTSDLGYSIAKNTIFSFHILVSKITCLFCFFIKDTLLLTNGAFFYNSCRVLNF
jgi:hypothetical protein